MTLLAPSLAGVGGLEKQTWAIAHALAKRGKEVDILTANAEAEGKRCDPLISLHALPQKGWCKSQKIASFDAHCKAWVDAHPSPIVFGMDRTRRQTHLRAGNGVHAAYLKRSRRTCGFLRRQTPLDRLCLRFEKEAFESSDLKVLFANSHMVKGEILSFYRTREEKIRVIHNGVEWEEWGERFVAWPEKRRDLCRKLHLDPDLYHFLFIGNGYVRKGLAPLLRGLGALSFGDFHLSVLGKERHLSRFLSLRDRLGLRDRVSFFGLRRDVDRFYQIADALVIPSLYDPFANVTGEALAMGLFVISSSHNGGCELLDEKNGTVIADLFDRDAFVEALSRGVMHPKTEGSARAIRDAIKHLDLSVQLAALIDLVLQ